MAASCSSTSSEVDQVRDITGCSNEQAVEMLKLAKGDVASAIHLFLDEQEDVVVVDVNMNSEDGHDLLTSGVNDIDSIVVNNKKIKLSSIINIDEEVEEMEGDKPAVLSDSNLEALTEEEIMAKAISASTNEYLQDEPDPESNLMILTTNFPHLDPTALRNLCEEYKHRSAELEKFVQTRIHEIPTKIEAEKTKLNNRISDLIAAGVEEAALMTVEECPGCKAVRIVEDPTAKVFVCYQCKGEFCRKCKEVQHIPFKCSNQDNIIFDEKDPFKIINILPKRGYDESDPLEKEFRTAESQFLRMNIISKKNYIIKSIDLVHNVELQKKFDQKQAELNLQGCGECLLLFHGTPQANILPILENNFDLSITTNGRAYGNGVYFSECPEVSIGYSRDQKSLILCKVLAGTNSKQVVRGDAHGRCWAVVVPDVNQILPKYVINFT